MNLLRSKYIHKLHIKKYKKYKKGNNIALQIMNYVTKYIKAHITTYEYTKSTLN